MRIPDLTIRNIIALCAVLAAIGGFFYGGDAREVAGGMLLLAFVAYEPVAYRSPEEVEARIRRREARETAEAQALAASRAAARVEFDALKAAVLDSMRDPHLVGETPYADFLRNSVALTLGVLAFPGDKLDDEDAREFDDSSDRDILVSHIRDAVTIGLDVACPPHLEADGRVYAALDAAADRILDAAAL